MLQIIIQFKSCLFNFWTEICLTKRVTKINHKNFSWNSKLIKCKISVCSLSKAPRTFSVIFSPYPFTDINPLHSNISMHILHTVLIYFVRCWQGEFVYRLKASFVGDHFLYSHDFNVIQGWYCREKLDANHPSGFKGLTPMWCMEFSMLSPVFKTRYRCLQFIPLWFVCTTLHCIILTL